MKSIPHGGSTLNADEAKFTKSAVFPKGNEKIMDNDFRLNVSHRR
tara:strand:- start:883 stop:1017 length:135 start_codon:yes stop_codon:yes gene_type:complete